MLSGKRIKKYTIEEFGFQLSSNAFAALKDRVDSLINSSLYESDQLDDWIMRILKASARLNKIKIRKQDIELIFEEIKFSEKEKGCDDECENDLQNDLDEKLQDDINLNIDDKNDGCESGGGFECSETDSQVNGTCNNLFNSDENIVNNDISIVKKDQRYEWRSVEIIQNPSQYEVDQSREEIERLKKIIQIILNKQAELTL